MDITKVLKNSLREKKKIARHVQASGNYVCYLSNISSFYLMFCLEPPQGVGPPKAKVLRLNILEKSKNLPVFGRSRFGIHIRRLR